MIRLLMTSLNMSASTMAMTAGANDQSPMSMGIVTETLDSALASTGNAKTKLNGTKYRMYRDTNALIECKIQNGSTVVKQKL